MEEKSLCVMRGEVPISTGFINIIAKDRELLASGSNNHCSVSERWCNFSRNNSSSLVEWNPSSGDFV